MRNSIVAASFMFSIAAFAGQAFDFGVREISINPDASGKYAFSLRGRTVAGVSVPYLTPQRNDTPAAFDLFPNGQPSDFTKNTGVAWQDICSTDIESDGTNYQCLRLGIFANGDGHIGTAKGGKGTIKNLHLQMNGGKVFVSGLVVTPTAKNECQPGQISWDKTFLYVCTGINHWKRARLSDWTN